MEGSREGAHGHRLSEEFQDESGLELSLGLSLSAADSRQKWKTSEGPATRSPSSVDQTGEPSAGGMLNGTHPFSKPKPSGKASGLDAALKKFLGHEDEQDESSKLLDGSYSFNLQKEKEKPNSDMDNKGKPFLFKELQVSPGLANSRGPSPAGTSPLQLMDVFKIGSNSSSPRSAEGLGQFDGDDGAQESSEQHRKSQEARKKRKHLIEEQKHQKKGKKDDKPGTHGFRRPGSNTWVSASAVDMDKALLGLRGDDANEQIQTENSQESGDGVKGYDTDGNESTGFDKNVSADMGPNDSRGTGDDSKGVEVNFMPRLQAPETGKKVVTQVEDDACNLTMNSHAAATNMKSQGREISMKGASPNNQKDGQVSTLTIGREGDKAGSPFQRQIEKVPSETSSASTDGTEKLEEKGRGGVGEASSSVPEVMGSDKAMNMSAAPPFFPPVAATSSAALPYPHSPYPVVPIPYSLPGSMPHASGMPFPVGSNFPYVMQYLPSDGSEQNSMRPAGGSSFQPLAGIEYPPPQSSTLEGTSWMQALRPPVVSPFTNASNGALYSRNAIGVVEDANNRLQVTRAHDNGSGNASLAGDVSSFQNHPLFRGVVRNGSQDPQLHQGPDAPLLSSLPIPAVPHFSSQLAISDHGERTLKEQGGIASFPGFAAQGLPGVPARPPSSGAKEDGGQEQAKFGGKAEYAHHRNIMEPSNLGQEEFRRAIGGHFHQGSTENLAVGDGLGEDLAHLQRGIAPGLKFGGSGTPPDLPWVYATGPNGRAVGGVLYRLSRTQLRVVCACHGKHMSPAEFNQHAGDVDIANAEKNIVVNSSPLTSQAT